MNYKIGKLSIGIVIERFHSQGGVERRTLELVNNLIAAGHDVHVYANRWARDCTFDVAFHYVPMLKLTRALKPWSFAWFASRLTSRSNHDLIHTQARVFSYDLATLGVGCHRAYLNAVGIDHETAPDRRFHRTVLELERRMLSPDKFDAGCRIITNSNKCREEFASYYSVPLSNIDVVRNGVDGDEFSPVKCMQNRDMYRMQMGILPDDIIVLFVGPGFRRKGLDTLLTAVSLLSSEKYLKALVIGREKEMSSAADLNLADKLIWAGGASSHEIIRYYAVADIFALPTRYDPFANSTMEALACGLPVITTTANGVSEILQDGRNAFIIDSNDHESLAERLRLLCRDEQVRKRLGEAGREAIQPYTWQRTAFETLNVYASVLQSRGK